MTRDPWSGAWLGVALIAMGLLFLIQNYLGYELRNWWALFILIPAVGAFTSAWNSWRSGDDAVAAAGAFTMGVIFTAVTLVFLLDLPWARIWPVFNHRRPRAADPRKAPEARPGSAVRRE